MGSRAEFRYRTERQTLFRRAVNRQSVEACYRIVLPQVRDASKTLARSMQPYYHSDFPGPKLKGWLYIPHYWAKYVHDGRGGFGPRRKRVLVWFRHPALNNDPRLAGGYPIRKRDIVRLTRDQFYDGLKASLWKKKPRWLKNPLMRIAKRVGPTRGHPFFELGPSVQPAVTEIVRKEIRGILRDHKLLQKRPLLRVQFG